MAQNRQLALLGQSVTVDSNGNPTFSGTPVPNSSFLRNRIINGDMRIDQRNAGASVTVNAVAQFFPVDRWYAAGQSTDGVFAVQRVADAPSGSGFVNSMKATVTTADASIGSTQAYFFVQRIEGFNTADFNFGTASAQSVTVSFWVKSSVTGAFGGRIGNSGSSRTYPFSYTISAANTWEYKTVTIAGDTTGTWLTDSGIGVDVMFSLGAGSSKKATAGAWSSSDIIAPTGSVDLISTLNATWNITGVQLEVGTAATPFERRQYGQELALCQRYYEKSYNLDVAPGAVTTLGAPRLRVPSTDFWWSVAFKVAKRTDATCVIYSNRISNSSGNLYQVDGTGSPTDRAVTVSSQSQTAYQMYSSTIGAVGSLVEWQWTASAEL